MIDTKTIEVYYKGNILSSLINLEIRRTEHSDLHSIFIFKRRKDKRATFKQLGNFLRGRVAFGEDGTANKTYAKQLTININTNNKFNRLPHRDVCCILARVIKWTRE